MHRPFALLGVAPLGARAGLATYASGMLDGAFFPLGEAMLGDQRGNLPFRPFGRDRLDKLWCLTLPLACEKSLHDRICARPWPEGR